MIENKKFTKREPEDPKVIEARWHKKREQIEILANNVRKVRYNISCDLKSDSEKVFLKALVVSMMLATGERVGNEASADNGHFGITWFRKKHIKINGNKITLNYVGKSGVDHEKSFSDEKLANALKKAIANSKSQFIFTTSDGHRIKADSINRYLADFDIRSKDIRGYSSNKWMLQKLSKIELPNEESEEKNAALRKKAFMKALRETARKVGHGSGTLRKHYLIPELESSFIDKAEIIDIADRDKYEDGGVVEKRKTEKSMTERVKEFMNDGGEISKYDLRDILGSSPEYPVQIVGGIKMRKVFMKPIYRIEK
jgi:DNA topoisomerase-1